MSETALTSFCKRFGNQRIGCLGVDSDVDRDDYGGHGGTWWFAIYLRIFRGNIWLGAIFYLLLQSGWKLMNLLPVSACLSIC